MRESATLPPRPRYASDQTDQVFIDHLYAAFTLSKDLLNLPRLVIEKRIDIYSSKNPDAKTLTELLPLFLVSEKNLHNHGADTLSVLIGSGDLVAAAPVIGTNTTSTVDERLLFLEKDAFPFNMRLVLTLGETYGGT